jgi:hypothetical protein
MRQSVKHPVHMLALLHPWAFIRMPTPLASAVTVPCLCLHCQCRCHAQRSSQDGRRRGGRPCSPGRPHELHHLTWPIAQPSVAGTVYVHACTQRFLGQCYGQLRCAPLNDSAMRSAVAVQETVERVACTGLGSLQKARQVLEAYTLESNTYYKVKDTYKDEDLLGLVKDKDCLQVQSCVHLVLWCGMGHAPACGQNLCFPAIPCGIPAYPCLQLAPVM